MSWHRQTTTPIESNMSVKLAIPASYDPPTGSIGDKLGVLADISEALDEFPIAVEPVVSDRRWKTFVDVQGAAEIDAIPPNEPLRRIRATELEPLKEVESVERESWQEILDNVG